MPELLASVATRRRFRIGVVGCGRISDRHFEAIASTPDLELVAVCDENAERAHQAAEKTGVACFTSFQSMLDTAPLDVVALCTPSGLHPRHGMLAAEHGLHVICEKPMATRLEEADALVRACDDAGVQLFVVKQNRLNPAIQLLKRSVDLGRFGRIYLANTTVRWNRPQSYYDMAPWRGTWEFDGGAFMNQASHYVDLVDWLIGPVESVQAYIATLARNIQVEDTATVGIRWRSGALGSVNVTMLTYPKNLEGSITVIGETGTARIGGLAVNEIQTWEFADKHPDDEKVASASYETQSVYGLGHPLYYANVVDVLRGRAEAETDGREGLRSLELLIASYTSARDGRRVALPLEY